MLSAIILLAALAPTDKLDDPTPPAPSGGIVTPVEPGGDPVPEPKATHSAHALPLVAPSCPCNQAATADALRDLRSDLSRLRAELAIAKAKPHVTPQAQAPAVPPKAQLYELYDVTGVRCTGYDPDELSRRVQQRDTYFTRRAAAAQAPPVFYSTLPAGYAASTNPASDYFGGIQSLPSFGGGFMGGGMSFGGGFTGGGCAGGACR